jgi:hypothetical protein
MITGSTNSRKGHRAENSYARTFRDLGFSKCTTSRIGSKFHDSLKIDLIGIPFNLQIKAGRCKNLSVGKELFLMDSCIKANFEPTHEDYNKPRLLLHRYDCMGVRKRVPEMELIFMSKNQFEIFKEMNPDLEYRSIKESKYETKSEFKYLVSMTFQYFIEEVVSQYRQ